MPLTRAGSQPSGFIEKGMRDSLLQRLDRHSVEARDAVGLRPQRDLARLREGPVSVVEELLTVERHSEATALGPERQLCHSPEATFMSALASCCRRPFTTR